MTTDDLTTEDLSRGGQTLSASDLAAEASALDAADPLRSLRDEFVGSETSLVYFDGNSLGRPPRSAAARLETFVREEWGGRLIRGWDESWMQLPFRIGDTIGRTALGAAPGQTVIGDSTTVLLYKLLRAAFDSRAAEDPRRVEIVVDRDNFPTDRFLVEGIAAERGGRVRWIEVDRAAGVSPGLLRGPSGPRPPWCC
jgi:kynureninase